jgi:translation initiation factor 1 (eIF-1/SUI1)
MDIRNLNSALDPFTKGETGKDTSKIHVRVQQRNGRKCITTIQGNISIYFLIIYNA